MMLGWTALGSTAQSHSGQWMLSSGWHVGLVMWWHNALVRDEDTTASINLLTPVCLDLSLTDVDSAGSKVPAALVLWDYRNHLHFGPWTSPFRRMVHSHSPDGVARLSLIHCLDRPTLFALRMRGIARVPGIALSTFSFVASHRRVNNAAILTIIRVIFIFFHRWNCCCYTIYYYVNIFTTMLVLRTSN